MLKKTIQLILLICLPFLLPAGFLAWKPGIKNATDYDQRLKLLAAAHNPLRENGEFRRRIWLNNGWLFQIPGGRSIQAAVPSCWNSIPGLENYEGKASYHRELTIPAIDGRRIFLVFQGVSYETKVILDDQIIGGHEGAYTPFEIELHPPVNALLRVLVDNRLSMKTLPGKFQGWKQVGGIFREVFLEERSEVFIKDGRIISEPEGKLKLEFLLDNALRRSGEFRVQAELSGAPQKVVLEKALKIEGAKEFAVSLEGIAPGVRPWSPEEPNLYSLSIRLLQDAGPDHALLDRLDYKIGFRKIETKGSQIFLNGKPFKARGVSRHNFYPGYYQSIPAGLVEADFKKIKEMGANLVRLGHYPNHPYALQLCDELGLLAWEEIPAWGSFSPDYSSPEVIAKAKSQLREMILRDRNHPSLALVGLANEIPSDRPSGENFVRELAGFARPLIGNQLLTAASFAYEKDLAAKFLDVIGFNCYWGWYSDTVSSSNQRLRRLAQKFRDMPVLISEYGADAQIGRHGARGDIYTEENQARFLEQTFRMLENQADISGGIIWSFSDFPDPRRALNPQPFTDQMGLVDENRHAKLGYQVAHSLYHGHPAGFEARSRLSGRIRDGALASILMLTIFFGLFRPIPRSGILAVPGFGRPARLFRRALRTIALQTLVLELIWRGWFEHQPLALIISFPYPSAKLLQSALNSGYRPLCFFGLLFLLWLTLGRFLSILGREDKIKRDPFELALGPGDPFSLALPYPLIGFFPALAAIAINLPSVIFSGGELVNQFTTISWALVQFCLLSLIVLSIFKVALVFRAGLGENLPRAFLALAGYVILVNFFASLWLMALLSI